MKSLITAILFSFVTSGLAFDLPSAVKKSIKKHCEGEVVGIEKERVKGFIVYAITSKEGKERTNYFFSESGRLIHHAREDQDDEENFKREKDEDREKNNERDEADRFDRFEDEKELSDEELEEIEEREGHEEDEEEGPETYEEINKEQLPEAARKFLKEHLGDKDYHAGKELVYIVETRVEGRELILIFNKDGQLVEKEFHDEEDEEEGEDEEDEEEGEDEEDEEEGED